MKSHSTALYEQKVLSKLGLLEITERPPVRCFFTHEGSKELIKGKAPSCNRSYDRDAKVAYWNKPNDIQVRVDGLKVKRKERKTNDLSPFSHSYFSSQPVWQRILLKKYSVNWIMC